MRRNSSTIVVLAGQIPAEVLAAASRSMNVALYRPEAPAGTEGDDDGPAAAAAALQRAGRSSSPYALVPADPLAAVAASASSATDAWAVGFEVLRPHQHKTLLEHWNGRAWSVDTADSVSGSVALSGVADLSASDAYAVGIGAAGSLLEHWNGTSWSPVALPDPAFRPVPGRVSPRRRPAMSGSSVPPRAPRPGRRSPRRSTSTAAPGRSCRWRSPARTPPRSPR